MKFYERVISDFGGYEKCKDILSQPNIDFIMNAQGLREHMLEYRRQHNIFEVGDKVVCWVTGRVGLIDCFIGDYFCMVKIKNDVGGFTFIKNNMEAIKHATDEEIKAGKRLEVNDGN